MQRISPYLQIAVVLVGAAALTFLLWEPWIEGVNAHATTLREIYFDDPFLAYAYLASIPFFVALYQAWKALLYVREGKGFSEATVRALRTIRRCGIALIGFAVGGMAFLLFKESDDRPPVIFMGLIVIAGAGLIAAAATRLERMVRNARA